MNYIRFDDIKWPLVFSLPQQWVFVYLFRFSFSYAIFDFQVEETFRRNNQIVIFLAICLLALFAVPNQTMYPLKSLIAFV